MWKPNIPKGFEPFKRITICSAFALAAVGGGTAWYQYDQKKKAETPTRNTPALIARQTTFKNTRVMMRDGVNPDQSEHVLDGSTMPAAVSGPPTYFNQAAGPQVKTPPVASPQTVEPPGLGQQLLINWGPMILLIGIWFFVMRRMSKNAANANNARLRTH